MDGLCVFSPAVNVHQCQSEPLHVELQCLNSESSSCPALTGPRCQQSNSQCADVHLE